ncbi:MAG: hypothetical protein EOP11_25700, partial [Proteobacteria bacterium]
MNGAYVKNARRTLTLAFGMLTLSFFLLSPTAEARPGCEGTKEPLKKICEKLVKKNGVKALSCVRTAAEQERLRKYFYSIGRPGQVAKRRSRHQLGLACDFSRNLGSQYEDIK